MSTNHRALLRDPWICLLSIYLCVLVFLSLHTSELSRSPYPVACMHVSKSEDGLHFYGFWLWKVSFISIDFGYLLSWFHPSSSVKFQIEIHLHWLWRVVKMSSTWHTLLCSGEVASHGACLFEFYCPSLDVEVVRLFYLIFSIVFYWFGWTTILPFLYQWQPCGNEIVFVSPSC